VGATSSNKDVGEKIAEKCAGLKMYLNETFNDLKMESMLDWIEARFNFF
jgi:hypothetical protein